MNGFERFELHFANPWFCFFFAFFLFFGGFVFFLFFGGFFGDLKDLIFLWVF